MTMSDDPRTYELTERPQNSTFLYPQTKSFSFGPCSILVGQENEGRWHMSIAHPSRLPTLEEMKEARKRTVPPEVFLCQPFPPRKYWFSLHDYCLHLWEIRDPSLIEQWKTEGEFAKKHLEEIRRQLK